MRKWMALILVLLLGIGTLTGCSTTEISYYNLLKEASSQKVYTEAGSIELDLAQLPASIFIDDPTLNEEMIKKAINEHRIEYSGKVDVNQDACQYDFYIIDKNNDKKTQVLSCIYKKNAIYVNIDNIVKYIQQFCSPEEKQRLDQFCRGAQWLKITDEELRNMGTENNPPPTINNLLQKSLRRQIVIQRLSDGLINDFCDNYTTKLIRENGNQYVFTLRGDQLINVIKPAASYTINNIDKLGRVLKAFVNSLSPTELTELGLTNEAKSQALQGIDFMVMSVKQDRDQSLSELENIDPASQQRFLNIVNDSKIVSTLEKTDESTYNMSSKLYLNLGNDPWDKMKLTLNTKNIRKTVDLVPVVVPTAKVITLTELLRPLPVK